MDKSKSIPLPEICEAALDMFKYLFYSRILHLDDEQHTVTTLSQQAKIQRLRAIMKKFIDSRPYSFFKIVVLPPNGEDIENAQFSLTVKNFEYHVKGLKPVNHVLIISNTWDSFTAHQETIDKNLIPISI